MKLSEAKQTVFSEKKAFASIYEKYKDKTWREYFQENFKKDNLSLSEKNVELLDAFEKLTEELLGKEKAKLTREILRENFFASTCDHHGILCHPFFLNASLVRSHKEMLGKKKCLVVLSCASVSTSNSSYPRGLFFHNEESKEVRMPFISLKYKMHPVYGLPAISKEIILKIFDQTISKSNDKIERKLDQLKDIILYEEKIFKAKYWSEQCSIITSLLWKETFGNDRGEMVYLDMETLAVKLLLEIHLDKNTEIKKLLFERLVREKFIRNLEDIQGAHNTLKKKGSHLFWYVDRKKRQQLFLQGESLVSPDGLVKIEMGRKEIEKLLLEKKLMPTMALCFSVISFYHGLTCGGGFSQVGYLGEMHDAYNKTFSLKKGALKTNIFTGEFVLATNLTNKKSNPVSLLDLFIYGGPTLSQKIDDLIQKTKISSTLDLMMSEFYKIITGKNVEIKDLPKIPEIISNKPEKKCVYCGNNPTNHLRAYIFQTMTVPMIPLLRLISFTDRPFAQKLAKVVLTPYLWIFRALGMVKMNRDKNKSFTKRSEVIWQEAEKRGIEMEQFVIWGKPIEQYRAKIGRSWKYFESIPLPPGSDTAAYSWMDDKAILKKKFRASGIPVAYGKSVSSIKSALEVFEKAEKPVIVKPQLGSRGRHTTTHLYTKNDLLKAYEVAKKLCHFVVTEEHLFGSVFRATYVGGEIVGILRGDPPRITGDGLHNIRELIELKNQTKKDLVKDVLITELLIEFLARQNLSLETILSKEQTIDLSEKIGISYGGFAAEEFPKAHPKTLEYLKKAGDFLKTPVVGFDFIIQDITADPDSQKWGIIEANSLPFINLHHFPLEGEPINVAGKVWDLWKK